MTIKYNSPVDLLISFDTTGSMYPCLALVQRVVAALVVRWSKKYTNLRVAIIVHGDYCDGKDTIHEHDFAEPSDAVKFSA